MPILEFDASELCHCGWELPLSVFALLPEADPNESSALDRTRVVRLMCPVCGHVHTFHPAPDEDEEPS